MSNTKNEAQLLTSPDSQLQSTTQEIDAAIEILQSRKGDWAALTIDERIVLLDQIIKDWAAIAQDVVSCCINAKEIKDGDPAGEEWMMFYPLAKHLRLLRCSLEDIKVSGRPKIPGPVKADQSGQVVAQIFPQTLYDKILFSGITFEVLMKPGLAQSDVYKSQAWAYSGEDSVGKVAMILGPGNISAMGPMDILYKLFVEGYVVVFKTHPTTAYMGSFIEKGFKQLIERGFLRIVYGGVDEGAYLCGHPGIDVLYMVGSNKTFEAIVYGAGPEGQLRKSRNEAILKKPITAELGCVSPFIIVPGPWSEKDLSYHAEHLVSGAINNAACNCITPRVVLQHAEWGQRKRFLDLVRKFFSIAPLRTAYYPGAHYRYDLFMDEHPEAEQFGSPTAKQLPWALIADVDTKNEHDICFTTEAFCSVLAEALIEADSIPEYLDRVVEFCNNSLWGTLSANIIVHPKSLKDPNVAAAVENAISNLKYGTVSVNLLSNVAYGLALSPWGGYPGYDSSDIQSGNCTVNNALMLSNVQKTVMRAPFQIKPKPPWFVTQNKKTGMMFKKLVELELEPSIWKMPGILATAIKAP